MKKALVAIAGLSCLLASADDASAYVKKAKTKTRSSSTTVSSSSVPGGMYVSGGLMYLPSVSFEEIDGSLDAGSGYGLRMAGGTSLGNFRLEGELKYTTGVEYIERWGTVKFSWEDSQISLMANGYYDISLGNKFGLFVTGGIGLVVDMMTETYEDSYYGVYDEYSDTECVFGYQIGGGVSYNMNLNTSVDFGYRFNGTSKRGNWVNIYSHELLLGMKYRF